MGWDECIFMPILSLYIQGKKARRVFSITGNMHTISLLHINNWYIMEFILDFILHIDQYMISIVQDYHTWAYAILFIIIFCETGLVLTPFLPGDSLLFVAGAISALPSMSIDIHILVLILFAAAVLGDSCNYMIQNMVGKRLFSPALCLSSALLLHL